MPAKEIKELRQAGKLEEALNLAKAELASQPDNIWSKRNISWVYYDYLKQNATPEQFDSFLSWLSEISNLNLPVEEKMLFDHLSWQIGSVVFKTFNTESAHFGKMMQLLEITKSFAYTKPSEGYSFLFKAFHKALKGTDKYLEFADWWDFSNLRPGDFEKEKMPNGNEIMAIAEQGYIAYAKHLLDKNMENGEMVIDKGKVESFLPKLARLVENYPKFQYPAYFQAKLLLALGDREDMLSALLPFAKKKKNDFWVWEILSEAFPDDEEKVFGLYCKALSCHSPEEMLINLRQKMAALFIIRQLYNEARTEIELLVTARNEKGYKIPSEVIQWQSKDWYLQATASKSNMNYYTKYFDFAEGFLFGDVPEEKAIVEFVNTDRKILNFIVSETKHGFFKYERFLKNVSIGDVLKVRFQSGTNEGLYLIHTVSKIADENFRNQFFKEVEGPVRISEGKAFGFLDDVFIHPSMVTKHKLVNGAHLSGKAIKTYNQEKKQWGWKLISIAVKNELKSQ
jgi:hypothetical protein